MDYSTPQARAKYWENRPEPNPNELTKNDIDLLKKNLKGKNFIELGPGIGRIVPYYPKNSNLLGVDITDAYFSKLSEETEKKGIDLKVIIHQEGISKQDVIELKDDSFDVGVATEVLLHIPAKEMKEDLKELLRVSKKVVIINYEDVSGRVSLSNHNFSHKLKDVLNELGAEYTGEYDWKDRKHRVVASVNKKVTEVKPPVKKKREKKKES